MSNSDTNTHNTNNNDAILNSVFQDTQRHFSRWTTLGVTNLNLTKRIPSPINSRQIHSYCASSNSALSHSYSTKWGSTWFLNLCNLFPHLMITRTTNGQMYYWKKKAYFAESKNISRQRSQCLQVTWKRSQFLSRFLPTFFLNLVLDLSGFFFRDRQNRSNTAGAHWGTALTLAAGVPFSSFGNWHHFRRLG